MNLTPDSSQPSRWPAWLRQIGHFGALIALGERRWGLVRLGLILAAAGGLALLGCAVEGANVTVEQVPALTRRLPVVGPVLGLLPPTWLAGPFTLFQPRCVRYAWPALLGPALAVWLGSRYLRDVFELPGVWRHGARYLAAAAFGLGCPRSTISAGRFKSAVNTFNLLERLGGPGFLEVELGQAVLCERLNGPSNILGAGVHFLSGFERVRAVISLEEQHHHFAEVEALTLDGVPVIARDFEAGFRVRLGAPRSTRAPYPFVPQAVLQIVQGLRVWSDGTVGEWQRDVLNELRAEVVRWIGTQTLDALTASSAANPRTAIQEQLLADPGLRRRLHDRGVELVWVSLGHLDCPPAVSRQRLLNWGARLEGDRLTEEMRIQQDHQEAQAWVSLEMQLGTLRASAEALQAAPALNEARPLKEMLLLQMAQLLDTLANPLTLAATDREPGPTP